MRTDACSKVRSFPQPFRRARELGVSAFSRHCFLRVPTDAPARARDLECVGRLGSDAAPRARQRFVRHADTRLPKTGRAYAEEPDEAQCTRPPDGARAGRSA